MTEGPGAATVKATAPTSPNDPGPPDRSRLIRRGVLVGGGPLVVVAVVVALASCQAPSNVSAGPASSSPTAGAAPASSSATSSTAPAPSPVDPTASPVALARQGCQAYTNNASNTIESARADNNLSEAIRVDSDQRLDSPMRVAYVALSDAAEGDPRYKPLYDDLNAVSDAIEHADPGGDLYPMAQADSVLNGECNSLGLLS